MSIGASQGRAGKGQGNVKTNKTTRRRLNNERKWGCKPMRRKRRGKKRTKFRIPTATGKAPNQPKPNHGMQKVQCASTKGVALGVSLSVEAVLWSRP